MCNLMFHNFVCHLHKPSIMNFFIPENYREGSPCFISLINKLIGYLYFMELNKKDLNLATFIFAFILFLYWLQLAGSVTAVFNCQGPLDAPIFVGSGMVSRKISHSVSDVPVSTAYEAMLRSKDAGAVAAVDRVPFSYLSANFTFNTDNCVSYFR